MEKRAHTVPAALILLLITFSVSGKSDVLRVPSEFPTIQAALDNLSAYDTVLVDSGCYFEALYAPALPFSMNGNIALNASGDTVLPTLDIGALPGADSLSCLTLSGDNAWICCFEFRNSLGAYDTLPRQVFGGIINHTARLELVNCRFDSVHMSVYGGDTISAVRCIFTNASVGAFAGSEGPTFAYHCSLQGNAPRLLAVKSGSRIDSCIFENNASGSMLLAFGNNIRIRGCEFGPRPPHIFGVVHITSFGESEIRECVFHDCQLGSECLLFETGAEFFDTSNAVVNNSFVDNQGGLGQGGICLNMRHLSGVNRELARTDSNIFLECRSSDALATAVVWNGHARGSHNRLESLLPVSTPALATFSLDGWHDDTSRFLHNTMNNIHYGANAFESYLDARWNWWGDSTGPYNGSLNPSGQGAEVGNGIEFIPWLTDTIVGASERPLNSHPSSFALSAYPNPFNAQTRIHISVPQRGNFALILYDVTGRQIGELFQGEILNNATVSFDARSLSSGVYFAKLEDGVSMESLASEKLILLK